MDRISHLPDELLLKILSLRPSAKDVVATMVLSKRWKFLWMYMPRLVYDDHIIDINQSPEYATFSRFVERSLFLHKAPVIETLHLKLGQNCGSGDIETWIRAAEKHCVHELIIEIDKPDPSYKTPVTLPGSLYTWCRTLKTLILSNAVLVDVASPVSFPSLKKLSLTCVKHGGEEFVNKLLSSCPVLEDLVVEQREDDSLTIMSVRVPSLKRLVLHRFDHNFSKNQSQGFKIDAPSLEHLGIFHTSGFCAIETNMTKVVDANIVFSTWNFWKKLGSVTSFKRLYLCIPSSNDVYPAGSVFHNLVHLKICTCETEWLNLLMRVLKDSPNLQALVLGQCHYLRSSEPRPSWNPSWNEPSSVPECLLSSLKTFEWTKYEGAEEEKEAVSFMIRSAKCLKKATISITSKSAESGKEHETMIKELFSSSRRSPDCQLECTVKL